MNQSKNNLIVQDLQEGIGTFLDKFKRLEVLLRSRGSFEDHDTFTRVYYELSRTNLILKRFEKDMRELISLRNYYSHNPISNQLLMMPTNHAQTMLDQLLDRLDLDKTLGETFTHRVVKCDISLPLVEVLAIMKGQGFSQVPIYSPRGYEGLLTHNLLGKWIVEGGGYDEKLLQTITTADLMRFGKQECHGNQASHGKQVCHGGQDQPHLSKDPVLFISQHKRISEMLYTYEALESPHRFDAFIMTENGKSTEAPLSIITSKDINQAYKWLT